jgi:hypothetical protein
MIRHIIIFIGTNLHVPPVYQKYNKMKPSNNLILKLLMKHIRSIPKLAKSFDFSYKQQKYNLSEYLIDIFYVLKTGIAWRDLRSHINWNSVYKTYVKLNTLDI